jgi:hypothetical protein
MSEVRIGAKVISKAAENRSTASSMSATRMHTWKKGKVVVGLVAEGDVVVSFFIGYISSYKY